MNDMLTTLLCSDKSNYFTDFLTIRDCYVLSWTNTAYNDFFQALMQTKIDTLLQTTFRKYLGDKTETFVSLLHKSGAVLSGSFVLQTVLQETWDLKPSDIDIFVPVGPRDMKKGYKCAYSWNNCTYHNYTTLEEFLFYHCREWDNSPVAGQEEQCRRYGKAFDDIAMVRNYLVDDSAKRPFPAIYEALTLGDASTVKTLARSLPPSSRDIEWQKAREKRFFATKDVVTADFRWQCSQCVSWHWTSWHWWNDVDIPEDIPETVRFQVIQKTCLPEQLVDNIYRFFDFDFCKVVCRVDENGRFHTEAKDWSSVFAKKCRFPEKLPYENKALPSTIQRYFKYLKRGFTFTSVDHGSIFKALVTLWYHILVSVDPKTRKRSYTDRPESRGLGTKSLDTAPLASITSETSIEAIKQVYLRVLDTLKHQLWYGPDKDAHALLVESLNQL